MIFAFLHFSTTYVVEKWRYVPVTHRRLLKNEFFNNLLNVSLAAGLSPRTSRLNYGSCPASRTMSILSRIVTLLVVATLAVACGKKGALYLPDQKPAPPAQEESQPK